MGVNINKLNTKLDKASVEEKLNDITVSLIQFSRNKVLNHCLSKKVGLKDEPSPRVLVNWVEKELVVIAPEDQRKNKRFDKLESTWLNILVELRGFGLSLQSLKRTRKILFEYKFNDFSLLKFHFINTILGEPQTLVVFKDGDARIINTDTYLQMHQKNRLQPHLSLNLEDYIKPEYPNHALEQEFNITDPFESAEKMKLLYFLKTGDYQYMKIKFSDDDVRYIENVNMLLNNSELLEALHKWSFDEILISIDDETETKITSKI